jgi:hypothetical protein
VWRGSDRVDDEEKGFKCVQCQTVSQVESPIEGLCTFCYEEIVVREWRKSGEEE